ncbi:MAG TPA: chromate resistance protein ChrB domain-containing protein, partial [Vicinamibacterales bacterium]|nr:chromate resistance protein ChrB domain-containing protein [Vicinamibacterales bacterium]
ISDAAVVRLSRVVHDLDLKDSKFGAPEAVTLGSAIDGLQLSCADDHQLLEQGMILFEAMYRSFGQHAPSPRPRPVAKTRRAPRASRATKRQKPPR